MPLRGIGPWTACDTAHRLGACLGLQPEKVCIHAGAKQGEAALGLDPERGSVEMSNRWNDCHYPTGFKWAARGRKERKA